MPRWSAKKRTHLQMYETCSEGTPISPVMATAEELAHWLADKLAARKQAAAQMAELSKKRVAACSSRK